MRNEGAELRAEREARLLAERERDFYRRIVEQAPVPMNVHVGADLRFRVVHPSTRSFFGGRNLDDVDPRELGSDPGHLAVVEAAERAMRTGATQRLHGLEREVQLADGATVRRSFDIVLRRFDDGNGAPLGVIVQFGEAGIAAAQRWIEDVLDALPIAVAVADPASGDLLYANKKAAAISASVPAVPKATDAGSPGLVPRGCPSREFSAATAEGPRHYRGAVQHVPGSGDTPSVMICTAQDVTAEKEALQALDAAAAADRRKSEFLAHFAHEIRNPLGTIIGFSELALLEQLSEAEDREFWQRVLVAGRQTLALANDYLDAQALAAGRLTIRPETFSPKELLEEAFAATSIAAQGKGVALRFGDGFEQLPAAIRSDATRLRQIVLNLLSNAIKYTDGGSVTVDATTGGEALLISVEDTGIGIATEAQARLFAAFERAGGEAARRPGTGLGLHLSKRLAQRLGGDLVLARSEPGRGSRFELSVRTQLSEA